MAQYYKFDKERASRKPGVTPLKEAIEYVFGKPHMKQGFEESYVTAHWAKIMGHPISSRTQKVYVRDRTLFLQIESAPLRNAGRGRVRHRADHAGARVCRAGRRRALSAADGPLLLLLGIDEYAIAQITLERVFVALAAAAR